MSDTTTIVSGTDFVCIPTKDFEAASAFYADTSASSARSAGATCPRGSSRPATSRSR